MVLDEKDVFLLVEAAFEHRKRAPLFVRVFAGSRELMEKKGKQLGEMLTRHGEIYNTKAAGPN